MAEHMSNDLAYDVLAQLGRAKRADDSLAITGGDDPVFLTPWRIAARGLGGAGRGRPRGLRPVAAEDRQAARL